MPDSVGSHRAPDHPLLVQGELWVDPPANIHGWCLLPDRPGTRVAVEILADGRLLAATVAAEFFGGAGDGRHGFSLALDAPLAGPATIVVEARERGTSTVFGRVVLFPDAMARPLDDRLAAIDRQVLRDPAIGVTGADMMHRALDGLGTLLCGHGIDRDTTCLARRAPRLALSAMPRVSLVLPAGLSLDRVLAWLEAVQCLCDSVPVELIIADDGADPRLRLLGRVMPALRILRVPPDMTGAVLNMLAGEARGRLLCFAQQDVPARPLISLPDLPAHVCMTDACGLWMCAEIFHAAGGFDPWLDTEAAHADIVMKSACLVTS